MDDMLALGATLLEPATTVEDARRAMATLAQCTSCDAALCRVLLNGGARAWLPLLRSDEIERLWAPYVVHCLPHSLLWMTEALQDCASPEEGAELARALAAVLVTSDAVLRCLEGGASVRLICALPARVCNAAAALCPPFFEAPAFFTHLCSAKVVQQLLGSSKVAELAVLLSSVAVLGQPQVTATALLRAEDLAGAAQCLALCSPQIYRRVLGLLVLGARDSKQLWELLAPTVGKDASARHVMESVLMVQTAQPRMQLLLQ
jgi:hypothetical protein